jgi:hypothetical protein
VHSKIILLVLIAFLVIGFAVAFHRATPAEPALAIALKYSGTTSENYAAFRVWVTNTSHVGSLPARLQFQWVDKSGHTDTCHADLEPLSQEVASTFIGVPAGSKKLRILFCGSPGPMRKQVNNLVRKLPMALQRIFPKSWLNRTDVHSPFPWNANPAAAGNVGTVLQSSTLRADVPDQRCWPLI